MTPPITTVAKGLCTSAPAPVAIAIGIKPSDATSAVISTGLSRVSAPSRTASTRGSPSPRSFSMNVIMTSPLSTATPESAMKPMAALMESGIPRRRSAAKRHAAEHQQRIRYRPEADEEQQENQKQRERNDDRQPLRRRDKLLELAAPSDPVAGRQFHLSHDLVPGVGDERTEVATPHIRGHHDPPFAILTTDQIGAGRQIDLGEF